VRISDLPIHVRQGQSHPAIDLVDALIAVADQGGTTALIGNESIVIYFAQSTEKSRVVHRYHPGPGILQYPVVLGLIVATEVRPRLKITCLQ
jgi:hypothetical protein